MAAGSYERSTLGRSLAEQGFVHCSFASQVGRIAELVYAGRTDVVLLRIDPDRVGHEIRVENLEGGSEGFPHIYGPVAVDAVVRADPVPLGGDGRLVLDGLAPIRSNVPAF